MDTTARIPMGSAGQLLSFFCGAGGLDLGFAQAGYEVIFAADYNSAAVETHRKNCTAAVARKVDLSTATADEIVKAIDEAQPGAAPRGIIGGPPCQGFSRANTKRTWDDPRNELVKSYVRMVVKLTAVYPIDFVVLENVPELLSAKNDAIYKYLRRTLSKHFELHVTCLNAAHFGVPQTRERVFIVGMRKGVDRRQKFAFPVGNKNDLMTVREAIAGLPEPAYYSKGLQVADIPLHPNHWTMQPKSKRFGPDLEPAGRSFIRLSWDRPSRTVAYGNREIHVHPSGVRRLSIFEAMLLQGFPRWYQLTGTLSDQVTQVSNAVPPPVAFAIAEKILAASPVTEQQKL